MTGQEELNRIAYLNKCIDEQVYYIKELREAIYGVSSPRLKTDVVQTSLEGDELANQLAKIEQEESKLDEMIHNFVTYKIKVMDRIHKMDDINHKHLLYYVYIDGHTLKEASVKFGWSYDHTRKIHRISVGEYDRT